MEANQAAEAAKAQAFYTKGQQDLQAAEAQQEMDQQVQQQVAAAQQQQAAAQQQQQAEQQAALAAPMHQAEHQAKAHAKEQARATMGGLQTPQAVSGAQAAPPQSSPPSGPQKGVTIKVGR
jgi:FKBP-type peptidyl-prolyl cis-trans isomerase